MCQCSPVDLLNKGCQCGAFEREQNQLWFNGTVYFIAKTIDHAEGLAKQELPSMENFKESWLAGDGNGWRVIPKDQILTFECSDANSYTLSAEDWVETYEPGYLALA